MLVRRLWIQHAWQNSVSSATFYSSRFPTETFSTPQCSEVTPAERQPALWKCSEVIHFWVDGDRSFLILRWVEGTTPRDAWESMTINQQRSMVDEVTGHCDTLASIRSKRIENVRGGPILEPYLAERPVRAFRPLECKWEQELLPSRRAWAEPGDWRFISLLSLWPRARNYHGGQS